eukprot:XP_013985687.1 PREDICTED: uncharacterized protein LOC106564175 [Salmo salar]
MSPPLRSSTARSCSSWIWVLRRCRDSCCWRSLPRCRLLSAPLSGLQLWTPPPLRTPVVDPSSPRYSSGGPLLPSGLQWWTPPPLRTPVVDLSSPRYSSGGPLLPSGLQWWTSPPLGTPVVDLSSPRDFSGGPLLPSGLQWWTSPPLGTPVVDLSSPRDSSGGLLLPSGLYWGDPCPCLWVGNVTMDLTEKHMLDLFKTLQGGRCNNGLENSRKCVGGLSLVCSSGTGSVCLECDLHHSDYLYLEGLNSGAVLLLHISQRDKKNGHTLTITDLREKDSATYKFRFITDQTGGKYTDVVLEMDPTSVSERENVTLTYRTICTLDPITAYSWYKNGQPIPNSNTYSPVYILFSVSSEHTGRYSCAVESHEDLSSAEETLCQM